MSQGTKSQLYQELKSAGVTFDRHYREYSTDELQASVDLLRQQPGYVAPVIQPKPEYAAQRAYQRDDGEKPIRTDENGFIWFREEVKKPAFPKSRARRKLTYLEPGVTSQTVVNGKYVETFEVAGDEHRTGEVRITILVPAHNEEFSLPVTLAALKQQTRAPDRVIVVADNCTDRTVQIAEEMGYEAIESVDNVHKKAVRSIRLWRSCSRTAMRRTSL